jgi:hypothetical protein
VSDLAEPLMSPEPPPTERRPTPLARWVAYRRRRIEAEIELSRNSRVPTWALAVLLVVCVAGWVGFVAIAG